MADARWSRRRVLAGASVLVLAPTRARASEPASAAETFAALEQLSSEVVAGVREGPSWQREVASLLARCDALDLRAAITLDWRAAAREAREHGQSAHVLDAAQLAGCASVPSFRRKLWLFRRGHGIVPHGHRDLVSAFVVLEGRFHARHYDRIRDEPDAIVIRPSDDRRFDVGDAAAICDQHDNVHWFHALDDDALLFNVGVTLPAALRMQRGRHAGPSERTYLDPEGEPLDEGLIRAPRSNLAALQAKYCG
jgi:hypothetical protein